MKMRTESDSIGELQIPNDAYYGVQTQRAIENFKISNQKQSSYPEFIRALGYVKKAAAIANYELGVLKEEVYQPILDACDDVIAGKLNDHFLTDMIQGGAGTSINMNANEVIANRALELMGKGRGQYQIVSPNDHVNRSQSTNDAYPTALKIALYFMHRKLIYKVKQAAETFKAKADAFANVIKMGRTQLQDAVPMTLGQEFMAFGHAMEKEISKLEFHAEHLLEVNLGATAIGTKINSPKGYSAIAIEKLKELTKLPIKRADDLFAATWDTSAFLSYSSAIKVLAVKTSKICNDLRILSSGPRAGLNEIHLPAVQPGSSIMPGKVNPVIPEVVNQVCFKVIGNHMAATFAAEAGQFQLNVMEPVLTHAIMENIQFFGNALDTLTKKCVDGITADYDSCIQMVKNSIGIVTALNPYIGYKNASKIAAQALESNRSIYDLALEYQYLSKEELESILDAKNMLGGE